jgi:hypothetical protein
VRAGGFPGAASRKADRLTLARRSTAIQEDLEDLPSTDSDPRSSSTPAVLAAPRSLVRSLRLPPFRFPPARR